MVGIAGDSCFSIFRNDWFHDCFYLCRIPFIPRKICSPRAVVCAIGLDSKRNWPARALLAQPRVGYE